MPSASPPPDGPAASSRTEHDLNVLLDALAFVQAPITIKRLSELLAAGEIRRAGGAQFHPTVVRELVHRLHERGQVELDAAGRAALPPARSWRAFAELVADASRRQHWWQVWRAWKRFDQTWYLETLGEDDLVAALRVVVFAGGRRQDLERLCQLCRDITPMHPALLAKALLRPFDETLWSAMDEALRWPLMQGLLQLVRGDHAPAALPLWRWLQAQWREAQAGRAPPLHDIARLALAEHLLLGGRSQEARRCVQGMDEAQQQAVDGAAMIVEGQWEAGAARFESAWKARAAQVGKRKQLFTEALTWLYAVALLARRDPAQWPALRRFVAAEAGRREADPTTFWGIWQHAVDQRLGDAPRQIGVFRLSEPAPGRHRLHGLVQTAHWLLAAWLGHRLPAASGVAAWASKVAADYEHHEQPWLARLVRRSAAMLLDQPPDPSDAEAPFPLAAGADRWREALQAIVAMGPAPGADAPAKAGAERVIWTLRCTSGGRIREVRPLLQKPGARGLGAPKPVSLATLSRRSQLATHDAAVMRAARKPTHGTELLLDRAKAVQALVGHPHVAWHDAPEQFIELREGLPRLEVLTQDEHLQFRLVDAIGARAADEAAADDDEEDDGDEDIARRRGAWRIALDDPSDQRPAVLLLREPDNSARLVRVTPSQSRVAELVSQGWKVPTSARHEIDAALRVLASHFQLASDADTGQEVPAHHALRAVLEPEREGLLLELLAAPFGEFGPRMPPGLGRVRVTTVHQGVTLSTRRDLDAERQAMAGLLAALPVLDDGQHRWRVDDPEQALALVEALAGLAPGIVSEWPKGRGLRVRRLEAHQVSLRLTRRQNWLALDGEARLDGDELLRIERLLELLAPGQRRYVALGDGDFLALSDSLRQQLADLRGLAQPHGQGLRMSTMAAVAWATQAGMPQVQGDADWAARCRAWDQAQVLDPRLPAGLQAELRDYQLAGWQWLARLAASGFGAVLADDMGLGKTVQTLALLAARADDGPALVVAPTSVCGNWLAEAARFTPGLTVAGYGDTQAPASDDELAEQTDASGSPGIAADATDGDDADRAEAGGGADTPSGPTDSARRAARRRQVQALGPGDVLVCSYGLLQGDAHILSSRRWHTVVLDEAQAIKNASTRRAKAAQGLDAGFRLALTGTPIENRLAELWSIMAFANPGLLGSAESFHQRFAAPIERDGDAEVRRRLRRLVGPFMLRRTKAEVLADLPPRTEILHTVVPGTRERALLEALRRQAAAQMEQVLADPAAAPQGRMHILAALTRLRRAACDPRLAAPELGLVGAKVQAFGELAEELAAGRHKALVFSQFTDFLALLRERLDLLGLRHHTLDGSTPAAQRTQRVSAFQAGDGDFFLISLKAGGFGLNLTMADYVVIADPWWNPAAEDQATGRAHRIGQTRPVTVYRLVTQGSIEERIVQLHQHKRTLAEGVLAGADEAGAAALDAQALLALLRGD